ncbi:hypothetical protein G6011_02955 [Alternaria panax]|uniref:Uncharacterized protein n=1 Tax=Alternaria panax TaxID=48097 RepID=A0AAD4F9M3_9PLEO|nr:hypothetical protein G6011_02955 [Alternaria panax]
MSKSIELGRAVLSSPATDHELWLTTLITISSKEDATYLHQLTSSQLLDMLISANTWVKRGHDMHIQMRLNLREESLPRKQLQDLTDAVLSAPVWDQLMLKPTQRTDIAVDPGTIRLNINHASVMGVQEEKKRHRLFSGVPAADVRPPEGITEVSLQSVHLCMDILEASPRRRVATKRSISSLSERTAPALDEDDSDTILHEMTPDDLLHDGDTHLKPTAPSAAACRKRKRPATETVSSTQLHPLDKTETSKWQRKRPTTDSPMQHKSHTEFRSSDRTDVASMVDGAMRLSICGTLNRPVVRWKAKASSFRLGLADVAPAMWRTGYLVAVSQRAHLIPTIARSLAQIGSVNPTSISLREKMDRLSTKAQETSSGRSGGKDPIAGYGVAEIHSAIASRLWTESQMSLLGKPMIPIQACIASSPYPEHPVSDDMLAEEEPHWYHTRRTTLFEDNSSWESSNDISASAEYAQTTQQYGTPLGSPYLDIDVRESEDDLLLDSSPQNTMTNTSCSADGLFHAPSSLDEYCLSMPLVSDQQSVTTEPHHCLSTLQTVGLSPDHLSIANSQNLHQPLSENDVDCTEELLLSP